MRLVRFQASDGPRLGLEQTGPAGLPGEGRILDLTRALQIYSLAQREEVGACFREGEALAEAGLLEAGRIGEVLAFIKEHGLESHLLGRERPRLLSPLARPGKIIALGLNYVGHARESGREPPGEPIFFGKASSAVIGPEEPVIYKAELGRVDPEVELAVVIGKKTKEVRLEEALYHVGGYTVLNDVTAREMQARDLANRLPWYRSKGIDTFCPVGPAIVLTDEIDDPDTLQLEMRVNGEVRQKGNTADLIFPVPFLIHYISRYITLEPGDIIATGTPEGVAPVKPGDVMEAWVERIGVLRNPVVEGLSV